MAKKIIPPKGKDGPSPAVVAAMQSKRPTISSDKLDKLKRLAEELRAVEHRIDNGDELLKTLKTERNEYRTKKIPEMMEGLGLPEVTVDPGGNESPYKVVSRTMYSANIKAEGGKDGWSKEKRAEAFDYLREIGHDDLIKTYVTYAFPKGITMRQIETFCKVVSKINLGKVKVPPSEIERGVHWGTLTSWLKDQVEKEKFVPDLEKIGGFVGKIVDIKEVGE